MLRTTLVPLSVVLCCACAGLNERSPLAEALPTAQVVVGIRPSALPRRDDSLVISPFTPTSFSTVAPQPSATPTAPISEQETVPTVPYGLNEVLGREGQIVALINQIRAEQGLPAYLYSTELSSAARAHSCDLAAQGLISHSSSDGRSLQERLAGSTPPWEWPSENIAVGFDDPVAVVAMWMDEPPEGWHRRNILDTEQRELGVGYCYAADDPANNHHYWTADFSRRSP